MFANEPNDPVDSTQFTFMHPKLDGFWDWPKVPDEKKVSAKLVFYGPCFPSAPKKRRRDTRRRRVRGINIVTVSPLLKFRFCKSGPPGSRYFLATCYFKPKIDLLKT